MVKPHHVLRARCGVVIAGLQRPRGERAGIGRALDMEGNYLRRNHFPRKTVMV
jgi:hypothetical protein